mgnify:CR=1 FL=1
MEVALKRCCGHRELVLVEVVTARERDVPSVADAEVAAHVEVLRELVRIAHRLGVELSTGVLAHRDTVAERERPRHVETHVAVGVGFCLASPTLFASATLGVHHRVVYVRLYVGIDAFLVILSVFLITVVVIAATEPFLKFVGRQREREVLRCTLEASELAHSPKRVVAHERASVLVELASVRGEEAYEAKTAVMLNV